jgi:hypothetical protein
MTLSDELLDEVQKLIYREWTIAFDNRKAVKAERNDGSLDWGLFHQSRLQYAEAVFTKYERLLKEIRDVAPLTRRNTADVR